MKTVSKQFIVLINQAPIGCRSGQNAVDAILAISIFDQPVAVIFTEDGVYQLFTGQSIEKSGPKEYRHQFQDLATYGVENLYMDSDSAKQRGIDESDLLLKPDWVDHHQISRILLESSHILTF